MSNVVNGFEHVAPDTRARVLEAVERLSYHPSELAHSLKVGRSGLIGLMLPELDTPYFAELTRAFVEQGTEHGMTVVIDQTDGDRCREISWIQRAAGGSLFDGLLLSPLALQAADLGVLSADNPVVFLGENPYPGFDKVMVDNFAAANEAVVHLASRGHRRIGAIGPEQAIQGASTQRFAGYRSGLAQTSLTFDERYVAIIDNFHRDQGYRAMTSLLDQPTPPDAVFCFSDPLALGALRALHERGIDVPGEIAVVGFDDIEDGRFSTPSLTSISPDKSWLAATAFDRLIRRLNGEHLEPETILAPYRLEIREST